MGTSGRLIAAETNIWAALVGAFSTVVVGILALYGARRRNGNSKPSTKRVAMPGRPWSL